MNFYILTPRHDFSGYWPDLNGPPVNINNIPDVDRIHETELSEYFGEGLSSPKKKGDFHGSANGKFFSERSLPLIREAARHKIIVKKSNLGGLNGQFYQAWITNVVDCLNLKLTKSSEPSHHISGKIGVIKHPAFDITKWDGSDLFIVPQDPNYKWFVTEKFVDEWRKMKFKGITFAKNFMDLQAIKL